MINFHLGKNSINQFNPFISFKMKFHIIIPQINKAIYISLFKMIFIILFILSLTAFLYYHFYYKLKDLPPGPTPLPFIGNIIELNKYGSMEQAFLKWRRQYGPIFTYWLGDLPVVSISDYQKIMETVVKDADNYADRKNFPVDKFIRGDPIHGVISSSGDLWREQRRFALQTLRDFGLNKNLMQERILDEITSMFGKLNANLDGANGEGVNLLEAIDIGIGSIINNLMFGYRLDGEKIKEFWVVKNMLDEHNKQMANPLALFSLVFPTLAQWIPPLKRNSDQVLGRIKYLFEFFESKIREHQKEMEMEDEAHWEQPKDYVEAFLREMRKRELSGDEGHYFCIEQLSNMCFDLWVAGQETTSNMLAWCIAFLLNNPECIERIYGELDSIIGDGDRLVTVSDKPNLPFINAVINETLRLGNLLPMNIGRIISNDTFLNGFILPRGTCITPEISVVLYDENIFPNHEKFMPDRFLDEEGKLKKCDQLIPFSLGKRQCLGESLARMELFLFIANIFNQYKVMPHINNKLPSLKRNPGPITRCSHFKCRIQKRK